jgi:hypothetical protein
MLTCIIQEILELGFIQLLFNINLKIYLWKLNINHDFNQLISTANIIVRIFYLKKKVMKKKINKY